MIKLDEVSIGGMSYSDYNPDLDILVSGGNIGLALAEKRWQIDPLFRARINGANTDYIGLTRVALRRFPECERGESVGDKEIRTRLREIRESGYNVEPYSKMSKQEAWDYLMQVRADIKGIAEIVCPNVLREVEAGNKRQRDDTFYCR